MPDQASDNGPAELRTLIIERYGTRADDLEVTLASFVKDPEKYCAPAGTLLKRVRADQDQEVLNRATELFRRAEAARPGITAGLVGQINAPGGRVAVVGGNVGGNLYLGNVTVSEDTTYDVAGLSNPYLGMASYTYATRDFYGGREEQVRDAVKCLTAPGSTQVLLFVTGASGCGKSSFVQAGLVPALDHAYAEHRRRVRWAVARPGLHPLAALAQALEDLGLGGSGAPRESVNVRAPEDVLALLSTGSPPEQVNVLVLDQFEELVTQSAASERDAVLSLLSNLPSFQRARTHVLVTLRSDYLPAVFQVPALFKVLKQQGIELRAMLPDELARAIGRPIEELNRRLGTDKRLEPALVTRLIEDAGSDSSLLPLLQVTLTALWDEPPHRLRAERYKTLTDALQVKADRVYERDRQGRDRTAAEQADLMAIFLDLVRVSLDDDPHRDVRQTLTRRELLSGHPERQALIEELVESRLLATWVQQRVGEPVDVVDIIHETLLRNWTRLRAAIAAERNVLQARERFRLFLREWETHARSDAYLLQGVQLDAARELAERKDVALQDQTAHQFWEASLLLADQERQQELAEERARSRSLRGRLVLALTALAVAVVATGAAVAGFVQANQQARTSASRELARAADGQLAADPELGILLAREGLRFQTTDQAVTALRRALLHSPARLRLPAQPVLPSLAFGPDGTVVAIGGAGGVVQLKDAQTGDTRAELSGHSGSITTIRFSDDGRQILTAGVDGSVRLWNAGTGEAVQSFAGIDGQAMDASFSPDGRRIAAAGSDGLARVWDARTGQLESALAGGTAGPLLVVRFAPGGQRLASAGLTTTRIWDLDTSQITADLASGIAPGSATVFDREGRRIVTRAADGAAHVWSVDTGAPLASLGGGPYPVRQAVFSPVDDSVLTVSDDRAARLWDAGTGQVLVALTGQAIPVSPPMFSPDGTRAVAVGPDYSALVWDLASGSSVELRGHTADVAGVQITPDGRGVATVSLDRTVRIWNADAGGDWRALGGSGERINSVATADGGRVATGSFDRTLRVWSLQGSPGPRVVRKLPADVTSVAFSPDGQRIAAGLRDGRTWLVGADATAEGDPERRPGELELSGHASYVNAAVFSPDGQRLATASEDGTCRLWDARAGQSLGQLPAAAGAVTTVAFDPRGRWLATGNPTGSVRLWDARTLDPVAELRGFADRINRVTFSPDGQLVMAGGKEAVVRVWQADGGHEVAVLGGHYGEILGVRFSASGRLALTTSGDGTAQVWDAVTWLPLARLSGGSREFNDGAFSQDEQQVIVGSGDGLARVYAREAFAPLKELENDFVPHRVLRDPAELTASERSTYVPTLPLFGTGQGAG